MTTTYKTTEYETIEALRDAINSDLSVLAYPYTVKHKTYGEGQLTFVKAPLLSPALYATIDFATGTKTFSLDVVFSSQLLTMPEDLTEILLEAQTAYKADFLAREQAQKEADRIIREEALAAEKKAEEDKKAEDAYQRRKAKALREFEELSEQVVPTDVTEDFYYALGWLARHIGTLTAIIPDYLSSAFEKYFGSDAPKTLVDGRAKTSGGYAKQWSWEFKCTIKKLKETEVPECLKNVTTDFSKGIHNTSFLWNLVANYGFQFGKTQDLDKIRSCIPSDYVSFFEAGLA
jgi:hypothetical protein